jgi:hypothetical protein
VAKYSKSEIGCPFSEATSIRVASTLKRGYLAILSFSKHPAYHALRRKKVSESSIRGRQHTVIQQAKTIKFKDRSISVSIVLASSQHVHPWFGGGDKSERRNCTETILSGQGAGRRR